MSIFAQAPEPKSKLGYYRLLSPSASVRVSPLCLGAMNFGTNWGAFLGSLEKKQVFEILDSYYENGGNFIDTACNYQDEQSETWIGEWMQSKQNRDQLVIATKYTLPYTGHRGPGIHVNNMGNSKKNLVLTVEASLKKLQTSYIDILYVHIWDYTTSIEELMQSLHQIVLSGKVLYLGVSDTPAWVVAKANQYARCHGFPQFVVYQGRWSVDDRDLEAEVIPMCIAEGMGICPWGALGGGKFKTEEQIKENEQKGEQTRNVSAVEPIAEKTKEVVKVLDKVAKEKGTSVTGVALAYVLQKIPYVFPIVGGRKVSHLQDNIAAISLKLTGEDIKQLEDQSPLRPLFPQSFIGTGPGRLGLINRAAKVVFVEEPKAISN